MVNFYSFYNNLMRLLFKDLLRLLHTDRFNRLAELPPLAPSTRLDTALIISKSRRIAFFHKNEDNKVEEMIVTKNCTRTGTASSKREVARKICNNATTEQPVLPIQVLVPLSLLPPLHRSRLWKPNTTADDCRWWSTEHDC